MEMLMAITYNEDGSKKVRKGNKKAIAMGPDYEMDREHLEARMNKKAREDAGKDMLLDEIFNRKKKKKGKA
jgi:hypothetical protein